MLVKGATEKHSLEVVGISSCLVAIFAYLCEIHDKISQKNTKKPVIIGSCCIKGIFYLNSLTCCPLVLDTYWSEWSYVVQKVLIYNYNTDPDIHWQLLVYFHCQSSWMGTQFVAMTIITKQSLFWKPQLENGDLIQGVLQLSILRPWHCYINVKFNWGACCHMFE